ncbi:MAG: AAA family ATPase [Candidatus Aminicenantes bacterium]|nr:AAA family ATPase [Candidatus Aminicenantes bacterium]
MYESYWGLNEKPFENTPDPRFLFLSSEHLEALTRLIYIVEELKGATLLTGEYGCGKTVLSRLLFEKLSPDKYNVALLTNPMLDPTELLEEICFQLGVESKETSSKTQLLRDLNDSLYRNMKNSKGTIIIVDEAQAIKNEQAFEELRLLLNFQLNDRFLLTLILIGQPELREMIGKMKQFKQRISMQYHLNPLNSNDSAKYITHRLKVAGVRRKIFTDDAVKIIWGHANGVPRVMNTICDTCLLTGLSMKVLEINEGIAGKAIQYLDQ